MKFSNLALNLILLCGVAAGQAQSCDLHDYEPVDGLR